MKSSGNWTRLAARRLTTHCTRPSCARDRSEGEEIAVREDGSGIVQGSLAAWSGTTPHLRPVKRVSWSFGGVTDLGGASVMDTVEFAVKQNGQLRDAS